MGRNEAKDFLLLSAARRRNSERHHTSVFSRTPSCDAKSFALSPLSSQRARRSFQTSALALLRFDSMQRTLRRRDSIEQGVVDRTVTLKRNHDIAFPTGSMRCVL